MEQPRIIDTEAEHIYIPATCSEHYLLPVIKHTDSDPYKMWIAGRSTLTTGYRADRKPSSFNLLMYCKDGAGYAEEGGRAVPIRPNDILIAPTQHTYSYFPSTASWEIVWIHLNDTPEWNLLTGNQLIVRHSRCIQQISDLIDIGLRESVTHRQDSSHAIHLTIEHIIFYLKRELIADSSTSIANRRSLEEVWESVQGNLQRKWSVDELAKLNHCSKTQFHQLCRKAYGKTPMHMLTGMRMEKAMKLLTFTNHTMDAISEAIGYDNAFTFSRAFYRYAGIRPNEYRKKAHPCT